MTAMEGWQIKRLDQIGDVYSGATPSTAKAEYWDGDIVWVTPNDLSKLQTPFLSESAKKITKRGLKNCSTHLLPARSVTISSRAPIGYVAVPVVDFCTNQGCKSIKLYPGYHPEFVYYNIHFNVEKLKNLGEGTTFAEISKTTLSAVEMPFLDNFEEQKQIASILSTLDRAIEQTEAIIAKQQRVKAGLMQDLLTKGIDEHGSIRSEATHEFKDSPLGRIPVEWEVVSVEDLCSNIVDCPHTTPTYVPSGVPCIRTADMIPGQLLLDQAYCITEEDYRERVARLIPKKGDVIYSREGERLGIASPVGNERVCLGQRVMLLRPGYETDPDYLLWAMNSPPFYNRIVTGLGATTSPHINVRDIRKALTLKPSPEEQRKIGRMLATQNLHFRSVTEQTVKYRKMKAGLMHDLLTGTVRVN